MKVFEKLPMELIDIILNYNGSIKLRNGVYINQIPRNDTRYELLKQFPPLYPYYSLRPSVIVLKVHSVHRFLVFG